MALGSSQAAPRYERLNFVLGQGDQGEATIVKDALRLRGVQHVADCGTGTDRLFNALDDQIVDAVVYDFELLRDRFVDVMQMIRKKSRGMNPFTVIVATVDDSNAETVKRLVRAGVDDLIRRPVTGERLFQSISSLMEQRKPFIVANDYVGPSRRLDGRTERPAGHSMIQVPNTMRSRAIEGVSEDEIQRMVEAAVANLRDKQLVACGGEIENLARVLMDRYALLKESPDRIDEVRAILRRLEVVSDDLHLRCRGTQFERIGDLAKMVLALTQRINRSSIGHAMTEVQLVNKLAAAIMRALAVERDSVGVMRDIADTIANFTGAKHKH